MDVLVDGEIVLYGTVGNIWWDDTGFSARDVLDALARLGRGADVTVRVNSGGGFADEGVTIFNALKAHRGKVTIFVDGMAASAASVIAMAGDEVVMRTGAIMMIHDPAVVTWGNTEEHERSVRYLEVSADGMADIYAEKSGKKAEDCRADMKAETWLGADEAVEQGYADRLEDKPANEPTAFDYRVYQHAPERLTALAAAKGWNFKARATAVNPASPIKEKTMTVKPNPAGADPAPMSAADIATAVSSATETARTETTKTVTAATLASAAEIVALCNGGGVPAMAEALLKEGVTAAVAKARVDGAKEIKAAVDIARKSQPAIAADQADRYIAAGLTIESVRADLYTKITAMQSPEIVTAHQGGATASIAGGAKDALNPSAIYASRAKARAAR